MRTDTLSNWIPHAAVDNHRRAELRPGIRRRHRTGSTALRSRPSHVTGGTIADMQFSTIAVDVRAPIAEIRLCRAEAGNPIDARCIEEIDAAAAMLHDDRSVLAVLLSAEGNVFSSGDSGEHRVSANGSLPFRSLELMAQPMIAVMHGDAVGAGLELALACDIRIAADDAIFTMPDIETGRLPSRGGTQRLPRIIGRTRAAAMILLGEPIDARAAFACGLVNAVAPTGEASAMAERLATTIASRGPLAVRFAKEALVRGLDMPLDQALRYETDLTIILQTTDDRAEGVAAFLEKRQPRFAGR